MFMSKAKLDFSEYKKNPVLLLAHDTEQPIGRVIIEGDSFELDIQDPCYAQMMKNGLLWLTYSGAFVGDDFRVDSMSLILNK